MKIVDIMAGLVNQFPADKIDYQISVRESVSKTHSNISYKTYSCIAQFPDIDVKGSASRAETGNAHYDETLVKKLAREDLCNKIGDYFGRSLESQILANELNAMLAGLIEKELEDEDLWRMPDAYDDRG